METINQQQALTALEDLFEHVSPKELHQSVEDLFFSYLSERDVIYPSHKMIRHMYLLLLFLREVDAETSSA